MILGLDGATWSLVQPYIDQGLLPNVKKLASRGVRAPLRSVPNMRSAAAWTSFMTGTNPGKHGIFEFYERLPGEYRIRFVNGSWRKGRAFWEILGDPSDQGRPGKRAGVVNVPMTYPARAMKGFLLAGLDAPGKESKGFCWPPDMVKRVEAAVGEYVLEPGVTGLLVAGNEKGAEHALLHSIAQRKKAFVHLMQTEPWDIFVAVFRETDNAHHCFWKYLEPDKVDADVEAGSVFSQTIEKVYRHLDAALGEILENVPPDAVVMIMSDHGFGFRQYGTSCLNRFLADTGLLAFRAKARGGLLKILYRSLEGLLKRSAKEKLVRLFPSLRDRVQSRLYFSPIDWSATRAYSDSVMPVVWINERGRDPQGIVEPGVEYDTVCAQVIDVLMDARDVYTGRTVAKAVHHRSEIYSGPHVDRAPDLLVAWKQDEPIFGLVPGGGGPAALPEFPTGEFTMITGEHRPDGIFIMSGPGVREGVELDRLSLLDICPTVLYGMGSAIPADVDGRAITEAFTSDFVATHAVRISDERSGTTCESDYDEEDAETLRRRLRDLGYID